MFTDSLEVCSYFLFLIKTFRIKAVGSCGEKHQTEIEKIVSNFFVRERKLTHLTNKFTIPAHQKCEIVSLRCCLSSYPGV